MCCLNSLRKQLLRSAFLCIINAPLAHADGYKYSAENKPDPFEPKLLLKTPIEGSGPLQQYDLSQLEVVGTMIGNEISALIATPDSNEGMFAHIGDKIGKNNGKIISISKDRIVIREPSPGPIVVGSKQRFVDVTKSWNAKKFTSEKATSAKGENKNPPYGDKNYLPLAPLTPTGDQVGPQSGGKFDAQY